MMPLRERLTKVLEERGMTVPALARAMAVRRGKVSGGRGLEVTLRQILQGVPRSPGGAPRELKERLLGEILDALGLEIAFVPVKAAVVTEGKARAKRKKASAVPTTP